MKKTARGFLFIVSGPSGVGKGTIRQELLGRYGDLDYSVSATTRKPRPGEVHGKDYFFVSQEEFQELLRNDALLEWAKVYDHFYGTPEQYVENLLAAGKDCILEIDVQGALQVKRKKPESILIFIAPPSKEELVRRITCRGTESRDEIEKRMKKVEGETQHLCEYNYRVVNEDLETAVESIRSIIIAERCRVDQSK